MTTEDNGYLTELTVEIVAAYVQNNPVPAANMPDLINSVYGTVAGLAASGAAGAPEEPREPAVSIKKSLQHDRLICLECGESFKSLKRHLGSNHGLTPAEYRERWGLKPDYPMVAPAYAAARSRLAKEAGLGQSRRKK